METLLVLGIIPGTDITVTFTTWLYLVALLLVGANLARIFAAVRSLFQILLITYLAWQISSGEVPAEFDATRHPQLA